LEAGFNGNRIRSVERPKIGVINAWDRCGPPSPGGAVGLWTCEVVKRLTNCCDVLVCSPRLKDEAAREECEGVRFARFPLVLDAYLLKLSERLKQSNGSRQPDFASHFYRRVFAERAGRALCAHGASAIHVLNLPQLIPIVRRTNPLARIVLHMECDWLAGLDPKPLDRDLSGADAIIGCSDYITGAIQRRFPHYADRCGTIYNGVDAAEFTPATGCERAGIGERVLFVNRISPEKGLHVLLGAFKRVLARRPKATLDVIGPDNTIPLEAATSLRDHPAVSRLAPFYQRNYAEEMRNRVQADSALRKGVSFSGPLPHAQLAGRMHQADILVQPSVFDEPFGIQIAEAMASGLPVIGSAAGGIPELIVDGQTGILVDRDDPGALARALLNLMDNPSLARKMGVAGRRRAEEKFSWEGITDDLKSYYFKPAVHPGVTLHADRRHSA
jgi:glycosyltransferase involved in cell wall biosynthesis